MAKEDKQKRLEEAIQDAVKRLYEICNQGSLANPLPCDREKCTTCHLRHDLMRSLEKKTLAQEKPRPLFRIAEALQKKVPTKKDDHGTAELLAVLKKMSTIRDVSESDVPAIVVVSFILDRDDVRAWQSPVAWVLKEELRAHLRLVKK